MWTFRWMWWVWVRRLFVPWGDVSSTSKSPTLSINHLITHEIKVGQKCSNFREKPGYSCSTVKWTWKMSKKMTKEREQEKWKWRKRRTSDSVCWKGEREGERERGRENFDMTSCSRSGDSEWSKHRGAFEVIPIVGIVCRIVWDRLPWSVKRHQSLEIWKPLCVLGCVWEKMVCVCACVSMPCEKEEKDLNNTWRKQNEKEEKSGMCVLSRQQQPHEHSLSQSHNYD